VQVCLFAFDCLFADGRTLLREPLSERRRLLYSCLNETEGHLQFAKERTRCAAALLLAKHEPPALTCSSAVAQPRPG
jgi:ATP-dependent DNA ligase